MEGREGMERHAALRADAEAIFRAAVAKVDPRALIRSTLSLDGSRLVIRPPDGTTAGAGGADAGAEAVYDLDGFERVLVLAFGKAACRMALGVEDVLGGRLSGGVAAVKKGFAEPLERVRVMEAAHPVPDESSVDAARAVLKLAREAGPKDLALVLVSGGGSAVLSAPWSDLLGGITLADKQATTRELLACGADIREINTVRRHLSSVKGGRLAAALSPASSVTLILSDVIGDELSSIASGPTVPDASTWQDALGILERYRIIGKVPPAVPALLRNGAGGMLADTPKPGDPVFEKVRNFVIGSNRVAALAAVEEARARGYESLYLGSRFEGEARELARAWLGMGIEAASRGAPVGAPGCIIGGGETTVTIRGEGLGGRNQEAALAFLIGLSESPAEWAPRLCFLSAGTDGNDGPTDAAGAFADLELLSRAREAGLDPRAYLERNDSWHFFDRIGGLLRTGPTGTNVCDLQLVLVR